MHRQSIVETRILKDYYLNKCQLGRKKLSPNQNTESSKIQSCISSYITVWLPALHHALIVTHEESREMSGQTHWQAKQPSQVACVSEDCSVEESEIHITRQHKTKSSHHQSPGGERHKQRKHLTSSLKGQERLKYY